MSHPKPEGLFQGFELGACREQLSFRLFPGEAFLLKVGR